MSGSSIIYFVTRPVFRKKIVARPMFKGAGVLSLHYNYVLIDWT